VKQKVRVLGLDFTVQAEAADPRYVEDVARHVETIAKRISANVPDLPRDRLVIMAALEIGDELFRKASAELPEERRGPMRLRKLAERIEAALMNDE